MRHRPPHTKRKIFGIAALLFCLVFGLATWNTLRPLPRVQVRTESLAVARPTATELVWPASGMAAVKAQGVTPLLTHGAQKAVPIGDLAQLITALTILQAKPMEAGDLGPTLTLTQADLDRFNQYRNAGLPTINVAPGEQLNEYQAMQTLLLTSAANTADSAAIWAFGSLGAYRTAATHYVKQLGLSDTVIGPDASGISPDTTSTPADLVRLGEQALAHPVLAKIMEQTGATLPIHGKIASTNQLAGKNGINGVKAGSDGLVFSTIAEVAPGKTVPVVGALLKQPSPAATFAAAPRLADSVKANLYLAQPIRAGQAIATFTTAWGSTAQALAKKDIAFVAWKGTGITPQVTLQHSGVSYAQGASVGTVSATSGTSSDTADIVMASTLEDPSFRWRLTRLP